MSKQLMFDFDVPFLRSQEKCFQYWPHERSVRYQCYVVDPIAEYNMPQYKLREFKVTDARDGSSRTVRQFQFIDWPEQGVPKSGEGFIDFIGQVHKTKEQFGQDGPITVHCSAGVGRTGVFITLSIVLERMQYEGVLDVFQTVRILRSQRPAMVQTEVSLGGEKRHSKQSFAPHSRCSTRTIKRTNDNMLLSLNVLSLLPTGSISVLLSCCAGVSRFV